MRARIASFFVIITMVLLAADALVGATWHGLTGESWRWMILPVILSLGFAPVTAVGMFHSSLALRMVYGACAIWVGLLSFFFFASITCWMVVGLAAATGMGLASSKIAFAIFGVTLAIALLGAINAMATRITRITVHLPYLPSAWQGRTIALVTDLHLGHLAGPWFLKRILAHLQNENTEMVLLSGDMFDGTQTGLDGLVAPWRDFSAPRGVFYVTGNHEEFSDRTKYIDAVKRAGIRVVHNEKINLDGLQLIGIHDREAVDPVSLRAILHEVQVDEFRPSILLAHQPAHMPIVEEAGVSLQLSGHTHKGQFWPWTLLVWRIYGRFAYGLQQLGGLQIYTSSGAGTWGPPFRVGTIPEIVIIRLEE